MQATYDDADLELPVNAAACPLPDHTCTLECALEAAAIAFARLYPGEPFLAPAPEPQGKSDEGDEAQDALAAALEDLGSA